MLLDQINLNHARVFESVFRHRNMTLAARELHLTQSGVSQHISAFEQAIGIKLFDRLLQKLVPTSQAMDLYKGFSLGLEHFEETLAKIKGVAHVLKGTARIGVPMEFGANVTIPSLAAFSKQHPEVIFQFHVGLASEMNALLLRGDIDLAFVDAFALDKRVALEKVYDEILDLCVHPELLKKWGAPKNQKSYFETLQYVDYQTDQAILNMWFQHHLGLKNPDLQVRATVLDVHGVTSLIVSGFGAGVLPRHLLEKLEIEGKRLHVFKGCGKPLKNSISLAYLEGRTFSPLIVALKQYLVEVWK